ncbi:SDR family NAD(P)-dependent oxidoreductase [Nocardioides sp. zg-1308]|uniref:SDR family oxidoreductase n=1 Tax=Nocardioides TaxID=1839 RepID=UPI0015542E83|nr:MULTISPECIES: SDR family NAD(P)-dependent oxidoreductase [unclassified Nocardioides]NPD05759.1 SDR family NAD(P)-dependent oxidoreductase [Nocardioides sp. zg-1308]WQQ23636.1 SDR family NAD(P)-dependent oxidoreductase [Nocardioides sp. S-34]
MTSGHALVVGATSDIGAAIVRRLVAGGRSVSAWGRSEPRLAALVAEHGRSVSTQEVDVTDAEAVRAGLTRLDGEAPSPLDVVVWAVGVFDWGPAHEADPDAWAHLLDVNLVAAARATPQLLTRLVTTSPSTLVLVGSGAAHRVFPDNAAYVASKHGLAALAAASFLDVKRHGVRVSVVSPGLVAAGAGLLSPQGVEDPTSLLQPEDVAAAVDFVVRFPGHGCPVLVELQPLV